FNGVNSFVDVGTTSDLQAAAALTLEAWVYPTGLGSDSSTGGLLVGKEGQFALARFPDGTLRYQIANLIDPSTGSSTLSGWVNPKYVVPLQQWTHVALTYDGGEVRVYANGVEVHEFNLGSTGTITGTIGNVLSAGTPSHFVIGGQANGAQCFAGGLDDV